MSYSFKLFPSHFLKGAKKFAGGASPPWLFYGHLARRFRGLTFFMGEIFPILQ